MGWRGPSEPGEYPTIGFTVLDWLSAYLPSPLDETKSLVLTDEQARYVLQWFRIDPERGVFPNRRGYIRMAKGWGKSPIAGALSIAELAGPVRFDGWDVDGEPVARPWGKGGDPAPWVQVAAVSEDQTANTYEEIYAFLRANDGAAADALAIDLGITRLFLKDRRGRLEPVTSAQQTREGQRVTFGVMDEQHLWLPSRGGPKLDRVIRRNAAKMDGRTLATTNAYIPGEDSVAERTEKALDEGTPGILPWIREGPEIDPKVDDDETLRQAFAKAYGDAWWVNLDRLIQEARDPDTPSEDVLRFFLNRVVKGVGRAVDPEQWRALVDAEGLEEVVWQDSTTLLPPEGAPIGVGFDGSETDDHTVIVGTTYENYRQFVLGHWDPTDYPGGQVPRLEVDELVAEIFDRYRVGRMHCDEARWKTDIERWARRFGEKTVLGFPQLVSWMGPATDRWLTAIEQGDLSHSGDASMSQHVLNSHKKMSARAYQGRKWPILTKAEHYRKIDLAVAAVMSLDAAANMDEPKQPTETEPFAVVT